MSRQPGYDIDQLCLPRGVFVFTHEVSNGRRFRRGQVTYGICERCDMPVYAIDDRDDLWRSEFTCIIEEQPDMAELL